MLLWALLLVICNTDALYGYVILTWDQFVSAILKKQSYGNMPMNSNWQNIRHRNKFWTSAPVSLEYASVVSPWKYLWGYIAVLSIKVQSNLLFAANHVHRLVIFIRISYFTRKYKCMLCMCVCMGLNKFWTNLMTLLNFNIPTRHTFST